jgi:hypothetical protein
MRALIIYIFDLISIAGVVGFMAFFPLTKLALGCVMTFLGAFFPGGKGEGHVECAWDEFKIIFRGCARFGVVAGGLIILGMAFSEGWENAKIGPHDAVAATVPDGYATPAPGLPASSGDESKGSAEVEVIPEINKTPVEVPAEPPVVPGEATPVATSDDGRMTEGKPDMEEKKEEQPAEQKEFVLILR